MIENMLRQYNPELALDEASLIPASWYLDKDLYELERKAVFGTGWQFVGLSETVSKPGSFLTAHIAGEPILVARDKAGKLQAFSNVCRHKATCVVEKECGTADYFQCRYHGWVYDLSGNLKGTPEFTGVKNFEKENHGLPRFEVQTFGPFVFVSLDKPEKPLEDFLSPLVKHSNGLDLTGLKWASRQSYPVQCNWKVYVDNYLDGGYHINTVHPGLAKSLDYSRYRSDIYAETVLQHSPTKTNPGDTLGVRGGREAQYWWLMPNLMINAYEGVMDVNWVLPEGPDKCRVVFDFFFSDTEGEKAQAFISESLKVADQVQREDEGVCESVQRGLSSQFYKPGRFSVKRENGNHHFHKLLAEKLWKSFKAGR